MKSTVKVTNHTNTCSMHQYADKLRKEGYKFAGSGVYGTVYKKGNSAIKIFRKASNRAYLAFVDTAIANQANTWFPTIAHVMHCEPSGSSRDLWCAVQMESLHHRNNNDVDRLCDKLEMLTYNYDSPYCTDAERKERDKALSEFEKMQKGAVECFDVLKPVFDRFSPDIHSGNFMFRKDGTLVLTDPVC